MPKRVPSTTRAVKEHAADEVALRCARALVNAPLRAFFEEELQLERSGAGPNPATITSAFESFENFEKFQKETLDDRFGGDAKAGISALHKVHALVVDPNTDLRELL